MNKSQTGGAVVPRNKELKRWEQQIRHTSKEQEIILAKKDGKLAAAEAAAMLLSESMRYLSEGIDAETNMSPQLIAQTHYANLQAQAEHLCEEER